jgi:hypothetical protein
MKYVSYLVKGELRMIQVDTTGDGNDVESFQYPT